MRTRFCVGMLTPAIRATALTPCKTCISVRAICRRAHPARPQRDSEARDYRKIAPHVKPRSGHFRLPDQALSLVQYPVDLSRHLLGARHPVHALQEPPGLVVGQDRRGLAPVGLQPHRHRLGLVVRPAYELGAPALVADARLLRLLELVVIALAALGADIASGDSLDQRRLV